MIKEIYEIVDKIKRKGFEVKINVSQVISTKYYVSVYDEKEIISFHKTCRNMNEVYNYLKEVYNVLKDLPDK